MSDQVIGIDGDDTLWHNETIFREVQDRFGELMASYGCDPETTAETLGRIERGHLPLYGYGVKGFGLALIETAVELTDGGVSSAQLSEITAWLREMLTHPVELLDGVADTVAALAERHQLLLITKGDLHDQGRKVKASGIEEHFDAVHIVAEKDPSTYAEILAGHGIAVDRFVMVGNSVRSDILPVTEIGGDAIHIEYHLTWDHEHVTPATAGSSPHLQLDTFGDLAAHFLGDSGPI